MVKKTTIVFVSILAAFSVLVIAAVGFLSFTIGGDDAGGISMGSGKIALIPVKGIITTQSVSGYFGQAQATSNDIVDWIEQADNDPRVRGIIFEINSPGGSPVASDEIAQAIENSEKVTVAWIRDTGASGAYWIASSCDQIIANRMSITGSIGVISSYLEFSGLLDDYNVTYTRLVAGKHKDIGSPFKELTSVEERHWQAQIDQMHDLFIEQVAENRGMTTEQAEELATGLFYTGLNAKENGLVDALGGKQEAIGYIERVEGIEASIVEYKKQPSFLEVLAGALYKGNFYLGRGLGYEISDSAAPQALLV